MDRETSNPQGLQKNRPQWKHLALTGMLSLLPVSAWTADYYVDADSGDDGNACDVANPCKSIKEAYDRTVSGDDIYLLGNAPFEIRGLKIKKNLTLHGEGKDATTLHPEGVSRHFRVEDGATLRLEDMTLEGGVRQGACGGSIWVDQGNLEVEGVAFINNQADCGGAISIDSGNLSSHNSEYRANLALVSDGGAIHCAVTGDASCSGLEFRNSEFTANFAKQKGGALYTEAPVEVRKSDYYVNVAESSGGAIYSTFNTDGTFVVRRSQFTGNKAYHGGAIYVLRGGGDIRTSAFVDNDAEFFGGAIRSEEDIDIVNSTFSSNSAATAGGIFGSGSLHFVTMVDNSANEGQGQDLLGTFEINRSLFTAVNEPRDETYWPTCDSSLAISGEYNLMDEESCGNGSGFLRGNHNSTDLRDLGYWGGRTRSYALESTSSAVDAANNCLGPNGVVGKDQRDVERPQSFGCDLGAYEVELAN